MAEHAYERARMNLEDAVHQALEAGMPRQEIENEVQYALDNAEEDDA